MSLNDYSLDYAGQCAAWTINNMGPARKQCSLEVTQSINGWVYLCRRHYELVEREFEAKLNGLNAERVENLQQRLDMTTALLKDAEAGIIQQLIPGDLQESEWKRKEQTVYFIRCQQYIKVGISKDPAARLRQIRKGGGSHFPRLLDVETSVLVATETGGLDREKELHAQFAHLRHTGEWFTEAPELTAYIESLSERQAA